MHVSFVSHGQVFEYFVHRQLEITADFQGIHGILLELTIIQAQYYHLFAAVCLDII